MKIVSEIKKKCLNFYFFNKDISFTIQISCMHFVQTVQNILNE